MCEYAKILQTQNCRSFPLKILWNLNCIHFITDNLKHFLNLDDCSETKIHAIAYIERRSFQVLQRRKKETNYKIKDGTAL